MNSAEIDEARATTVRMWHKAAEQHTAGYMSKAVAGWGEAMNYQRQKAAEAGYPTDTRYLPDHGYTVALGHMAALEIHVKMKILGLSKSNFVVLADPERVVNPGYLDLFRPHLTILPRDAVADIRLTEDYLAVIELYDKWTWFIEVNCIVEKLWQDSGRGPLFKLSDEQIDVGRKKLGLTPDEWFVCLHIRKLHDAQNMRDILDASIYDASIKLIEAAGGKVFQIPSGFPQTDMFLLAQSRFVILGNSGPAWAAGTFGTPALLTNWCPPAIGYPYKGAIFLHKKLWHKGEQRFLTPEEYNVEPFSQIVSEAVLETHNVASIPNTPEEILDGVERMLKQTAS